MTSAQRIAIRGFLDVLYASTTAREAHCNWATVVHEVGLIGPAVEGNRILHYNIDDSAKHSRFETTEYI